MRANNIRLLVTAIEDHEVVDFDITTGISLISLLSPAIQGPIQVYLYTRARLCLQTIEIDSFQRFRETYRIIGDHESSIVDGQFDQTTMELSLRWNSPPQNLAIGVHYSIPFITDGPGHSRPVQKVNWKSEGF